MINAITSRLGVAPLAGLCVVLYAAASLMWTPGGAPAPPAVHLASLALCFWLGRRLPHLEVAWSLIYYLLVGLGLCLLPWMDLNPNMVGVWMAFGLALAIAFNIWFMWLPLGFGLVVSQSRGALIAGGLIALLGLWRRFPVIAFALLCFAVIFAITSKGGDAFSGESLRGRMGVWQDTLNHLTFFGSGWGSFADAYASWPLRRNMTLQLANHPYNDFLEVLHDLGIGAIGVWVFVALCLRNAPPPFLLIAFAFFACGLTHSPLWMPLVPQAFLLFLGIASTSPAYTASRVWPATCG